MRYLIAAVICCFMLAGCASTGPKCSDFSATETTHGVQGASSGFTVVGVVKLFKPTASQAMASLHRKVKGDITEVGYTLENVTEKDSEVNLILVSFPRKIITADVVPKKGRDR